MNDFFNTLSWCRINIKSIFKIEYGNKFDRCNMIENENSDIAFVTRTASNNGIGTFVEYVDDIEPYPAGCLTVALGGSLGSTFLQPTRFYTAQNIAVLIPRDDIGIELNNKHKLFLATLIKKESDIRFIPFGRELNTHINKDFSIKLPVKTNGIIDWEKIDDIMAKLSSNCNVKTSIHENGSFINLNKWHHFEIGKLFPNNSLCRGKVHKKEDLPDGDDYYYIGAKKNNNGVVLRCGYDANFISKGNCIVFICNGQGSVGYTLYMDKDFMASGDLVLGYNPHINKYTGLFLVSVLDKERFKYSFGRKYGKYLKNTKILLPSKDGKEPDWEYMEEYIKSLPYGDTI